MLRFHGVNGEHRPSAMTSLDARGVTCIVVSILMLGLASCDEVEATCVDSMDCAFGQACRDAKCVVVKCVYAKDCLPETEICPDISQTDALGGKRVCTAPCSVFHLCPSGQFCRDKVCWKSEATDVDVREDVTRDMFEDCVTVVDGVGLDIRDDNSGQTELGRDDIGVLYDFGHVDVSLKDTADVLQEDFGGQSDFLGADANSCVPDCGGRECGLDPECGSQECGFCRDGLICQGNGICCMPDCSKVECGPDPVCGGHTCGTCKGTDVCVDGQCAWQAAKYTVNCGPDGMCLVPAGQFWMGCNDTVDGVCRANENPFHLVTLSAFLIDRTEVTQASYNKCLKAGACSSPESSWDPSGAPNRPVVEVNWVQAGEYCAWAGKRLPTEAEWEKAARGTDGRMYPWGNQTPDCNLAVMDSGGFGCGTGFVLDVCSKSPKGDSPYGLCDMSGNAWEWVSDWYAEDYYGCCTDFVNPVGSGPATYRVMRGGCYKDTQSLRSSNRSTGTPTYSMVSRGFRCAKSIP